MIDPADLNDPAKANAFLRETIEELTADIAQMKIDIAEQIRSFSERHADDPDAVSKFAHRMQKRCELQTGYMRQRRDELVRVIACVDACRKLTS